MVVALAGILLILGIPALQGFGQRQRMSAAMNALHSQLQLARNQAIHLNAQAVVCPGSAAGGCEDDSDWSDGWIVFTDFNADQQFEAELDSLLRAEPGLEQLLVRSTSGRSRVRFFPNGSAPGSNGSITFCDARGPLHARKLVLSNLGRIRRDQAEGLDPRHCP